MHETVSGKRADAPRTPHNVQISSITSEHTPMSQDVVAHLHRLGHASSAGEVIKELQFLAPRLGTRALSELSLSALTALAEAHLRDRHEPSRDALTGLLDARAFNELLRAHARHARAVDPAAETVAVVLTLLDAGALAREPHTIETIKTLARLCTEEVAADDYVGRVAAASIAVLPRNGGVRGAESVRARLMAACGREFAGAALAPRLQVELRDAAGSTRAAVEVGLGAQAQVA
jgi:GGDEF domain-containing protein